MQQSSTHADSRSTDPDPRSLRGEWQLDRTMYDHLSGVHGTAHGVLEISESPSAHRTGTFNGCTQLLALAFHEHGVLNWQGRSTDFFRDNILRPVNPASEPKDWWMFFADGRAFHPWRPGTIVAHPCAADEYRGLIELTAPQRFETTWYVLGPSKHHTYRTRFQRIDHD
jgi:hypothetical protein